MRVIIIKYSATNGRISIISQKHTMYSLDFFFLSLFSSLPLCSTQHVPIQCMNKVTRGNL